MSSSATGIKHPTLRHHAVSRLLLNRFRDLQWVQALNARLVRGAQSEASGAEVYLEHLLNPSVKALLISTLYKLQPRMTVMVCPDPMSTLKLYHELRQYLSEEEVERFPAEDFTPYDLSVFPVGALKDQYRIHQKLKDNKVFVLLVSCKNLLLKHWSYDAVLAHSLSFSVKEDLPPENLVRHCLDMGYVRTSMILEPGEFSARGDIVDVFPVNGDPVRITFFGDTVESIKEIEVENQRSVRSIKTLQILPRSTMVLNEENKEHLKEKLQAILDTEAKTLTDVQWEGLSTTVNNQINGLAQEFLPDGIEYYAPLVHPEYETLLSEIPQDALMVLEDWVVFNQDLEALAIRLAHQYQEGIEKGRLLDLSFQYHLSADEIQNTLQTRFSQRLYLDTLPLAGMVDGMDTGKPVGGGMFPVDVSAPPGFKADLKQATEYFQAQRRQGIQVLVTTDYPQRVLDTCKEWDTPAIYWAEDADEMHDLTQLPGLEILISKEGPREGFALAHEKTIHFTDTELFGRKQKRLLTDRRGGSRRDDVDVIHSISELRQGDYVVHAKHGIGRFVETSLMEIDGEKREYLSIQYAGTDRLYVPADQANQLTRYRGAGEAPPKLNRMGGMEWSAVKKKAKKSIQSIAKDLVALYAARAKAQGHPFDMDSPWQVEMEEAFPYSETPDQWTAIQDAKKDMESDKPMDRLVCGDVGFGKTEVAIRAIFKAVLSGKQVAVLVPTTILAQQHFNTLTERFKPYPVRVGLMSRFRSAKEQKEVAARLGMGECDVVVGTHRILQKDIKFKDLGLLVIDEEQRFGVAHKEKIKQFKNEVDVLTLTATPIPRTLYLSLSGVREMSLINTPPLNRSPIKTYVGPYNPAQIRMAILQEVDRGGQVYFVHNRVQTIYSKAEELSQLVPEVRIAVGHGQMNEQDLENVMLDFSMQQFDVLLATTIIESGLDIPNANTMIVDRADRLGLAQLYQLRGRVGRSPVQAYAYCYYDPERQLSEDAKDRLRAIREFTTLGSGYQIALRDLEIRGVGNVLGAEQHGHMVSIGFDLYCQMLDESIEELKEGKVIEEKESAIIDLNVTAFMPNEWIGDKDVKLNEYKRLANIDSERSLEVIQAEWQDRFGSIPWETTQLVDLVRLRLMATELGIPLVRSDEEYIRINVPFTLQEWMKYQAKLPPEIGKKARWVPGISSKQGSLPVLLVKHLLMEGKDQVDYLRELLKGLLKIKHELMSEV
jgi:transcription-repair coupling factor (superfamily II helicase)